MARNVLFRILPASITGKAGGCQEARTQEQPPSHSDGSVESTPAGKLLGGNWRVCWSCWHVFCDLQCAELWDSLSDNLPRQRYAQQIGLVGSSMADTGSARTRHLEHGGVAGREQNSHDDASSAGW